MFTKSATTTSGQVSPGPFATVKSQYRLIEDNVATSITRSTEQGTQTLLMGSASSCAAHSTQVPGVGSIWCSLQLQELPATVPVHGTHTPLASEVSLAAQGVQSVALMRRSGSGGPTGR